MINIKVIMMLAQVMVSPEQQRFILWWLWLAFHDNPSISCWGISVWTKVVVLLDIWALILVVQLQKYIKSQTILPTALTGGQIFFRRTLKIRVLCFSFLEIPVKKNKVDIYRLHLPGLGLSVVMWSEISLCYVYNSKVFNRSTCTFTLYYIAEVTRQVVAVVAQILASYWPSWFLWLVLVLGMGFSDTQTLWTQDTQLSVQ